MALHRLATHETTDAEGRAFLMLGPDAEEVRCARCNGEAFPHLCFAEWENGKHHHHGHVHDLVDGNWKLVGLCDDCHFNYAHERIEHKRSVAARTGVRS